MDTSDTGSREARPADTSAGPGWNDLPLPLRECGEIAVLRLSSALSDALAQTSELLFTEATEALTPHEREAFLDAAEFARNHRRGIVYDFMKHFEDRFIRACHRRPSTLLGHVIDFDVKELRIIEHHVLDDSLEPGKITEAIQNACWKTLQSLTSQFRAMLGDHDLMPSDIPLGPKIIEAATSDAIRDQPWRHKAKQRLAHALRWPLAARVNQLYRDLVDHLSARDLKAFSVVAQASAPPVSQPTAQTAQAARPAEPPAALHNDKATMQGTADPESVETDASTAAWDEVARCLDVAGLPQVVTDFLSHHWRNHLAAIHAGHGPDSGAWRDAVHTMDDLVWSLAAKPSREDCLRLMEGMPDLLRRLGEGMDALNLRPEIRNDLLVFLTRHHAELVKASLARAPATAEPVAPPIPAVDDEPRIDVWIAGLKAGTWLEFHEPGGDAKELKLAWISPHRSLFLLTNRLGERALSLSAEAFARMAQEGALRCMAHAQAGHAGPKAQPLPENRLARTAP